MVLTRDDMIGYNAIVEHGDFSRLFTMPGMTLDRLYEIIETSQSNIGEYAAIIRQKANYINNTTQNATENFQNPNAVMTAVRAGFGGHSLLLARSGDIKTPGGCFKIMHIMPVIQEAIQKFVEQIGNPDALDGEYLHGLNRAFTELLDRYEGRIKALSEYLQECDRQDARKDISDTIAIMQRGIDMMKPIVDKYFEELHEESAQNDKLKEERQLVMSGMPWQAIIKFIRGDIKEVDDIKKKFPNNESQLGHFRSECGVAISNMLHCRCYLQGNIISIKGIDVINPRQEEREIVQQYELSLGHWNGSRLNMSHDDKLTQGDIDLLSYALAENSTILFPAAVGRYWKIRLKDESERLGSETNAIENTQADVLSPESREDNKRTEVEKARDEATSAVIQKPGPVMVDHPLPAELASGAAGIEKKVLDAPLAPVTSDEIKSEVAQNLSSISDADIRIDSSSKEDSAREHLFQKFLEVCEKMQQDNKEHWTLSFALRTVIAAVKHVQAILGFGGPQNQL